MNLSSKAKIKMADQMLRYLGKMEEEDEEEDMFSEKQDDLVEDLFEDKEMKAKPKVTVFNLSKKVKKKV